MYKLFYSNQYGLEKMVFKILSDTRISINITFIEINSVFSWIIR